VFRFLRPNVPEITVEQLDKDLREARFLVLDVREAWEYHAGHVPGAIHVPLGELGRRARDLPTDRPIAVICQSGNRSLSGVAHLTNAGFDGAVSVAGGTGRWARMGLPIESGASRGR
jgi:rhodanese-related sulfurtransferase